MLSVKILQYASTCAYCDKGVEGGEGIRLLRTTGNGRSGLDFHKDCFSKVIRTAEGFAATELVESGGVFYHPDEAPGIVVPFNEPKPQGPKKVIPKRRP